MSKVTITLAGGNEKVNSSYTCVWGGFLQLERIENFWMSFYLEQSKHSVA